MLGEDEDDLFELPSAQAARDDVLTLELDGWEGPLDLLLYLIRRQNLDILDIPMAPLTRQYLEYVEMMRTKNLELAAEYLVMAAMLLEIKSRMLLPRPKMVEEEELDPRAELVRRLLENEQYARQAEAVGAKIQREDGLETACRALEQLHHADLPLAAPVHTLPIAQQQLVHAVAPHEFHRDERTALVLAVLEDGHDARVH